MLEIYDVKKNIYELTQFNYSKFIKSNILEICN